MKIGEGCLFSLFLLCAAIPAVMALDLVHPPDGTLLHGAFSPVFYPPNEMAVTTESIRSFEDATGTPLSIGVVSSEWSINRSFPTKQAALIREEGAVPYIRLMLRSSTSQYQSEPFFTLPRIKDGYYDADLIRWADEAKNFSTPVIVEWGTEANGAWFPWNGYWNGYEDGPEKFRDAYRHIIDLMRKVGADNLIWVFHINGNSVPDEDWNYWINYYPGDDYIDWIGVSVYGALSQESRAEISFSEKVDRIYPEISAIKPVIISEFGTDLSSTAVDPRIWTEDALRNLTSGRWPKIIGFCWWNCEWPNDRIYSHNTTMRITPGSDISVLFRQYLGNVSSSRKNTR
jgi:hypothetical protein